MLWGSIRRRCLSANQSVRYAAVSLAGLLAAYLLLRVSYPPPPAGVPSCAGGWAEFRVAANCNALLAELRATPACCARDPPARCCTLAAEAAAGRCHCAAGEYRGVGAALAAVRGHCRAPPAGPAGAAAGGGARPGLDEGGGGAGGEVTFEGGGDERFGGQPRVEGLREEVERAVVGQGAHRGRQARPAAEAGRGRGKRGGAGAAARGLPQDAAQALARRARPLGGGQGAASADLPPAGNASAAGAAAAGGPPPRLFVGVLSAAANADARAAIRETWGADPRLHRVLFVVAKPAGGAAFAALRREAADAGDLALLPHVWEGYRNITHQTLEVLRAGALDPAVTHTLKVDDDSFVRVGPLLARLAPLPRQRLLLGWIDADPGGPHRDPGHTWYVSAAEWAPDAYPPWAHGAGYVLSQDLVREIAGGAALAASNHSLFRLEDIALGAWVAYVAAERRWDVAYTSDRRFNYNGCAPGDIVSHYVRPAAARCMFAAGGRCCAGDGKPKLAKPESDA